MWCVSSNLREGHTASAFAENFVTINIKRTTLLEAAEKGPVARLLLWR
jgi:hypothetical protein